MEKFFDLIKMIQGMEDDFRKFYEKGNKAAGTRIRKGMQDVKAMAQTIRVDVQGKKGTE